MSAKPVLLDLAGLKCPLPVLRTRKALAMARAGTQFEIRCTDPMAAIDIPNLLRETGDRLEGSERQDGMIIFRVAKAGEAA